tara:strand:+ start:97 stop:381 length:285 start_codon:yes stop_codon:yes gene_type:complete
MISITQMKYLTYIEDYASIDEASDALFKTSTAVAFSIRSLERKLGNKLFTSTRTKQSDFSPRKYKHVVRPTKYGEKVIRVCRNVLKEVEKIKDL